MDVSILHTDVRLHPDFVVDIAALVDGRPIRVNVERAAVERLLGPQVLDEHALSNALRRNLETIRIAIEAYVFARGVPIDRYFVLSWRDFSTFVDAPPASIAGA